MKRVEKKTKQLEIAHRDDEPKDGAPLLLLQDDATQWAFAAGKAQEIVEAAIASYEAPLRDRVRA